MEVFLKPLTKKDAEALYVFELENREFFEQMVPSRGDEYYETDLFNKKYENLLEEQCRREGFFYLIKDKQGSIMGRMNVTLDQSKGGGEVGYRVGRDFTGKGVACRALTLLLERMEAGNITRLEAKTTSNHIASIKILEKNGFTYMGTSDNTFNMFGQDQRFVYYCWSSQTLKEGGI